MNDKKWTVVTTQRYSITGCVLAVFTQFLFAMEYAAFVTYFDREHHYLGWTTYVVEGDYLNV